MDRNQELLGRIKKLEDRETEATKSLSEQVEANHCLRRNMEGLNKKLDERNTQLNTANQVPTQAFIPSLVMCLIICWLTPGVCSQTISSLKDEIRELNQKIQNQDSTISTQTIENQELQEQLDLKHRWRHIHTTLWC